MKQSEILDLKEVTTWVTNQEETDLWSGGKVEFPIDLEQTASVIEWHAAKNRSLFVETELVAFGQIISKPDRRLHLSRLIVKPKRRGSGFGKELVVELIRESLSLQPSSLSLNVHPQNERAISLYYSLGFRPSEVVPLDGSPKFLYMVHSR